MRVWIKCLVVLCFAAAVPARAQFVGTAFTYQGTLEVSNTPANGSYDLRFGVFDTAGGATPIVGSTPILVNDLAISGGVFTVSLDFGNAVFLGGPVFLEIGVRAAAAGGPGDFTGFTSLTPRQPIRPAPYALHAEQVAINSVGADEIADDSIGSGEVDSAQIQLRSATMATDCSTAGLAIKSIASNGTVTCDSGPTVSAPLAKVGNNISLSGAANYARKDTAAGDQSFDGGTLHLDYTNHRVGILDTTPGSALDVAGTVRADAFELRAGVVSQVTVSGATFIPSGANSVPYYPHSLGYGIIAGAGGGRVELYAPLQIPAGATTTGMNCSWYDNDSVSSFTEINIELRRRASGQTMNDIVHTISATTSGANNTLAGSSTIGGGAVINGSDQIFLYVRLLVDGFNGAGLRFYGCNVSFSRTTIGN